MSAHIDVTYTTDTHTDKVPLKPILLCAKIFIKFARVHKFWFYQQQLFNTTVSLIKYLDKYFYVYAHMYVH